MQSKFFAKLDIFKYLRLKKNSKIFIENKDGTETELDPSDLAGGNAVTGITAFATGGQTNAVQLDTGFTNITTCATDGDSVKLPTAELGKVVVIKNSGATPAAVFPSTSDSINAYAVNLSINIPVGGMVELRAISDTVWETNEAVTIASPSTQNGEFVLKATNNSGDTATTLTNAAHGQATTINLVDVGLATSYVPQSTAALTAVEVDVLDGATQGAGVASKATVLDSSGDHLMATGDYWKLSTATLAAAGTTKADATAATQQVNQATSVDGAKGVGLPAAADGAEQTFVNTNDVYALKVYTVISGNDVINGLATDEAFLLGPGQTATFKATSATQWYVDEAKARPARETHFEYFDDFTGPAIQLTGVREALWVVFEGSEGAATVGVTITSPEGGINMGSAAANGAQDKTVLSLIATTMGSLVSLGKTVFETRVAFDVITGTSWGFGLSGTLANATEVANFTVNSGTVAANVNDGISFAFDTDATTAEWQAVSVNNTTVGNSAAEEALGSAPVVNTYATLRIEVDASGDARWYVDGALVASRAAALLTTAVLIPYIYGDSAVDAQSAVVTTNDYILFQGHRNSSIA